MMNYEEFKEAVVSKFMDYMPDEMQHMELKVSEIVKVNEKLDGISVVDPQKTRGVSPMLYINRMYEKYQETNAFEDIMNMTAFRMVQEMKNISIKVPELNYENVKNNVVMRLINTKQNEELLTGIPHREFQDLSIVYRWMVSEEGTVLMTDELAKQIGMSEKQMYEAAVENTRRINPPVVKSGGEMLSEMMRQNGAPEEMIAMMMDEMSEDKTMWVISNEKGCNGAASMLYEDKLHELAEKVGTDLYILPSSVHEVIAVSTEMGEPNDLAQMVQEINMSQVAMNERLSNQVYHYDRKTREITLASDAPNRRLDGQEINAPNRRRGR